MEENKNKSDFEKIKIIAVFSYVIFFLPFLTEYKSDNFAKFHANQSLVLLIFGIFSSIVASILAIISFGLLLFLPSIFGFIYLGFMIIGMINAYNGEMKKLPIIGEIEIIK